MDETLVLGVALIGLPIAFNVLFTSLARSFDYPDILRQEPAEILTRFLAGGRRLILVWWAFTEPGAGRSPSVSYPSPTSAGRCGCSCWA